MVYMQYTYWECVGWTILAVVTLFQEHYGIGRAGVIHVAQIHIKVCSRYQARNMDSLIFDFV